MPRHLFQVTVNLPGSFRNNINNNEVFNPYVFVRNRLYHFLFNRFALIYAGVFSKMHRQLIEFFILLTALFSFILLAYVHVVFVQTPITCLHHYKDVWQSGGILRVEVLSGKGKENYTLQDSYFKEKAIRLQYIDGQARFFYSDHPRRAESEEIYPFEEEAAANETIKDQDELDAFNTLNTDDFQESDPIDSDSEIPLEEESFHTLSEASILATDPNDAYIIEFSLEYGYLRLRPSKRKELNITVIFVILDPEENACFGGSFNKFLLDYVLGYDNVLLASVKSMVEKRNTKGFVRNAVMEIEYAFLNNYMNDKSFFTAGFVMIVFTLTISTLLRHSHHQIFIVVGYWMHQILSTLERRSNMFDAVWPRSILPTSGAPVLTVILALVGMEAVMSDFFHDRSIALHIIVIVWFADLYDAVCCQSPLSKRHWYRFFYLYHYLFYAYNYKFNGVYWPLSLMTSWLFTLHSMVFFFHHYELPRFLHRAAVINATITQAHMTMRNNASGNDPPPPPNNQNSTNESPEPPNQTEATGDDQPNDRESNPPDPQQTAGNLVDEGVESAPGYNAVTSAGVESSSTSKNCYDDNHLFQICPGLKESSSRIIKNIACHLQEGEELRSFYNFSKPQTFELKSLDINNKFLERKSAENRTVENIFESIEMSYDRPKKRNLSICQKRSVWCLDDLHSRLRVN